MKFCVLILLSSAFVVGCTKKQPSTESAPTSAAALAERGKVVYQTTCTACHNADPAKDGGVGPAVAGSSRELLEARVLTKDYPAGYKPKRDSQVMPAFPHLKNDIEALTAYLNPAK